ncbi:MAG: NAD(P)/FAD-dependent oxidoreductase [Clostridia bacterium]|nr:NAD(P)/FAD-dependent oxidoreductase [Clostridia bacterium]
MIKTINITVPLETSKEELVSIASKKSGLNKKSITGYRINRRSVDARRKKVQFNYSISLFTENSQIAPPLGVEKGSKKLESRPIIIGTGPAGLFCAYALAKNGYRPLVFERGKKVEDRVKSIDLLNTMGKLDTETNIQFGEGGAGTFSDGKLTTRIDSIHCAEVLETFIKFGAPDEIQYLAKAHIGTDILRKVIVNMREEIIRLGGNVLFENKLEDINIKNGKIDSITVNNEKIDCKVLILAIGHSARDTYYMLSNKQIFMEPKAFAVGVRIEHLQKYIDQTQYGEYAGHPMLGAADYSLKYNGNDRSCFSFCMCPGGYVVGAMSEEDTVVTNGMSNYARNGENSNSALVVNVTQNDYQGVLGGIEFQRQLERAAYDKNKPYFAPVQNTIDFLNNKVSLSVKNPLPTYPIGYVEKDLNTILPPFVSKTLQEALPYFDTRMKDYTQNSVITGVETRTSAPVRITRGEDMQSITVKGIYPIGEGAGYAGGIMSAAVDGIKTAEKIIQEYSPIE